jgi:hypothetical protein
MILSAEPASGVGARSQYRRYLEKLDGRDFPDRLARSGRCARMTVPGTVQHFVQQSRRQTADRDSSGRNRDREVFRRKP